MRLNYNDCEFEPISVRGIRCLFTDERIDRKTVPKNMYLYEVRHWDDDWGIPCEIATHVAVNFYGTIISNSRLPLNDEGYMLIDPDDMRFSTRR